MAAHGWIALFNQPALNFLHSAKSAATGKLKRALDRRSSSVMERALSLHRYLCL
jgi:hypothetical protein